MGKHLAVRSAPWPQFPVLLRDIEVVPSQRGGINKEVRWSALRNTLLDGMRNWPESIDRHRSTACSDDSAIFSDSLTSLDRSVFLLPRTTLICQAVNMTAG
eukprot:5969100-Pyramimonas_sp.AAC.1